MCSSPAGPGAPLHPAEGEILDRNRKGNIAEAAVVFHAARLGINVCRPLLEHGRYDLVLDIGGRLLRVQCKWAQHVGDVVVIRLIGSRFTPSGYVRTTYLRDEIDAVAGYCAPLDVCYLLPSELIAGRTTIQLRLAQTKNGQEAGLHWATQYEFSGAVAQVVEHCHGMAGARVRVPAAPRTEVAENDLVVAAHEFRNRFGYYMELAEAGTHIEVTRWGRPCVRLLPAAEPLEGSASPRRSGLNHHRERRG